MLPPPPISTLFPYTTLFRSVLCRPADEAEELCSRDGVTIRQDYLIVMSSNQPQMLGSGHLPGQPTNIALSLKDRKSTRLNSSHVRISYAVFCLKKKKNKEQL